MIRVKKGVEVGERNSTLKMVKTNKDSFGL